MSKALVMRPISLAPGLPPLQAVQLPDGQVGATLRSLCAFLQLNVLSQQRRIERSRHLRSALMTVTVATGGGPQEMSVLLAWIIPLWVIGIQANRLDTARRTRVSIIQTQAVQALYRAFSDAVSPAEEAIESEVVSGDGLEARLAAVEKMVRDLTSRVRAVERLLAAAIERILWLQHYVMQFRIQQGEKLPRRRRGRPRRDGEKEQE